jgi:hypothetical protein
MSTKIKFSCSCGKRLAAHPNAAGKKAKCPSCGQIVQIPALPKAGDSDVGLAPLDDVPHVGETLANKNDGTARSRLRRVLPALDSASPLAPIDESALARSIWDEEANASFPAGGTPNSSAIQGAPSKQRPKDVLTRDEYSNYRNIRAVSMLFVVLGIILVLVGVALVLDPKGRAFAEMSLGVAVGLALVGIAGSVGGVAALFGNRRLAPLIYVMAAIYILAFPLGTILSFVMFKGLSRYLDSLDRIKGTS